MSHDASGNAVGRGLLRGHPPGLLTCAATEMWERFSFYGMRALLVFYLTRHFRFTDAESFGIYGAYTALVYMSTIVGGAVADRWLGARRAVLLGGVLLVIGHLGLAVEGPAAVVRIAPDGTKIIERSAAHFDAFLLALAFIVVGVGFLKTNATALVGALYARDDARRDAGFTTYYMLYNLGGAAAPLVCGWLGERFGWAYGFGAAGIGMLLGLGIFVVGQRHLAGHGEAPPGAVLDARVLPGVSRGAVVHVASIALVAVAWWMLRTRGGVGILLSAVGIGLGLWIIWYAAARCTADERGPLIASAVLAAFTVGFWAFYEQMGSSLNLFTDRIVDRTVFGQEIPASMLQSFPPIFVVLLAPVFAALWEALGRRGREPSTGVKFALAMMQLAAAFLLLSLGTRLAGADGSVPLVWLIVTYLLLVTGELCLGPVGLSMVTRLAPQRIVGVMVGAFFLAYAASNFIAGLLARLTSARTIDGVLADRGEALVRYGAVYARFGGLALAVAVLLLMLTPTLRRLSREGHTRVIPA